MTEEVKKEVGEATREMKKQLEDLKRKFAELEDALKPREICNKLLQKCRS
jgi:prefoldin subunit 5